MRGGIEVILGFALGYLALTDEGRAMGNKIADAAMKGGKVVVQNYIKKNTASALQERKEERHENH